MMYWSMAFDILVLPQSARGPQQLLLLIQCSLVNCLRVTVPAQGHQKKNLGIEVAIPLAKNVLTKAEPLV